MIYSRGPSDEYDRLATVSGDPGWTWDNLEPYRLKVRCHRSNVLTCSKTMAIERDAHPSVEQPKQCRRI